MLGSADAFRDSRASKGETARKTRPREKKEGGGESRGDREAREGERDERGRREKEERKSLVCIRVTLYHEAIAQVGTRPP